MVILIVILILIVTDYQYQYDYEYHHHIHSMILDSDTENEITDGHGRSDHWIDAIMRWSVIQSVIVTLGDCESLKLKYDYLLRVRRNPLRHTYWQSQSLNFRESNEISRKTNDWRVTEKKCARLTGSRADRGTGFHFLFLSPTNTCGTFIQLIHQRK